MRKEENVQLRMSLQLNKMSIIFQKQEHFEALISSLEVINATIIDVFIIIVYRLF